MKDFLRRVYRRCLGRRATYQFNRWLFGLSLRGLGILNFESEQASGEAWFLQRLAHVRSQLVALDVGANVGDYANRLKSLAANATLFAFEPHPLTFKQLQAHAAKFHYTAINQACSDVPGQMELYDYAGSVAGSQHASLHKAVIEQTHGGTAQAWQVAVTTLDAFCAEQQIQAIDLLKIDTEGHELHVLRGARQMLARGAIGLIHFEFNEMNIVSRVFFHDFYDGLPGYQFYRMLPDGLAPLGPYNPVLYEIFGYQNVVAVRDTYPGRQVLLHG